MNKRGRPSQKFKNVNLQKIEHGRTESSMCLQLDTYNLTELLLSFSKIINYNIRNSHGARNHF